MRGLFLRWCRAFARRASPRQKKMKSIRRMMYALQSEYRWQFDDSWIFTGFAGFGEVAETFGDFGNNLLPAAGIRARFILSRKHRVGLAADIAVGNDGTEFYFGVGEAF